MVLYEELKQSFCVPDAWNKWSAYRNTLTNYLIRFVEEEAVPLRVLSGMYQDVVLPTLAVVGAGECNDLDIEKLLPYFSKIVLMDRDETALDRAMKKIDNPRKGIVEKQVLSFTGISEPEMRNFTQALQEYLKVVQGSITTESFSSYAMEYVKAQYERKRRIELPQQTYDYVWCFGVHSQLQGLYGYIYQVFMRYLQEFHLQGEMDEEDAFYELLRDENRKMIPRMNDWLMKITKKCCVIGNEWDLIDNPKQEYLLCEYPSHAIEGAYQSICDIRARGLEVEEKMILWPFHKDKHIYYEVLIQQIEIEEEII